MDMLQGSLFHIHFIPIESSLNTFNSQARIKIKPQTPKIYISRSKLTHMLNKVLSSYFENIIMRRKKRTTTVLVSKLAAYQNH